MSNPEADETTRRALIGACDAVRTGDWARLDDFAHPEAVLDITDGIHIRGLAQVAPYFDYYLAYYRCDFTDMTVTVSGDEAAAEITITITYIKDKPGFPKCTGQTSTFVMAVFAQMRDGKVDRARLMFSLEDWLRAFSEAPMPAAGTTV